MAFEVVDSDEIDFGTEEPKVEKVKRPVKAVPQNEIQQASTRSVSYATDYKPGSGAGKPRIYEVVIETVQYNKGSTRINYSHTIKYEGHEEFFDSHDA